jgi:hypothetical protein
LTKCPDCLEGKIESIPVDQNEGHTFLWYNGSSYYIFKLEYPRGIVKLMG